MSANKHKIEFKCSVLLNLHMWKRPEFPMIMGWLRVRAAHFLHLSTSVLRVLVCLCIKHHGRLCNICLESDYMWAYGPVKTLTRCSVWPCVPWSFLPSGTVVRYWSRRLGEEKSRQGRRWDWGFHREGRGWRKTVKKNTWWRQMSTRLSWDRRSTQVHP